MMDVDESSTAGREATASSSLSSSVRHLVEEAQKNNKSNKALPFPIKLHVMLEMAENNGMSDVISWELNGQAFKVHDSDKFVDLGKF
jgi:hypothetical protein